MKNMMKRITALALVLCLVFPCLISCETKKSPLETIEDALQVSIQASAKTKQSKLFEKISQGGSMELRVDAGPMLGMLLGFTGGEFDIDASVKAYYNAIGGKMALSAALKSGGISVADALLYMADKSVSVSSNALFGKEVYGFSLENFSEKFNNSEFGENGAFSLGITEDALSTFLGSLNSVSADYVANATKYTQDMNAAWKELKKDLYPEIESHGIIEQLEGSVEIAGTPHTTKDIVFTYTGEDAKALLTETLTLIRDHEAVAKMVQCYFDMATLYYTEEMMSEMGEDVSAETLHAELIDGINELLAEISALTAEDLPQTLVQTVHISASGKEIIGVDVHMTDDDTPYECRFVCGPSSTDLDEIGLYFKSGTEEEGIIESSVSYKVTKDDDTAYEAILHVSGEEAEDLLSSNNADILVLKWDKTSSAYTANITIEGETLGIGGRFTEDEESLTFTANTLSVSGITLDLGEIAWVCRANDTMPENGAYTDLFTMSAEDIAAVISEIAEAAESILAVFAQ